MVSIIIYYNLMGPPSYMRSVVDRNVRRRIFVLSHVNNSPVECGRTYFLSLPRTCCHLQTAVATSLSANKVFHPTRDI